MKKRHSIHLLLAAAALLLAMAACTKDELADGDRLPEGQYPLEIARITLGVEGGEAQPWGAPATRVSETVDGTGSVFDTGDPFTVQIDDGTETATYTVQGDDTATSDAPLYWTNTTPNRTVSAWYPATDGTLDLGNQSQSLVYLLSGTGTGDYQTPVTLNFTHQLAKVRVTPKADALGEVTSLQLYTYTQCTYEKGKAGQGSQEGWIEMKKCEYTENGATITCWEANVVPGYEIKKLRANGTEERDLSSAFTPEASKFYNITLDKDKGYNLSTDGRTYEVYNADGLLAWNEAARNDLSINCTLTDNIDLTGKEWTPIGDYDNRYTGTFDGGNHTITGLTINQYGSYVGMIDFLDSGGTVQNLTLENVNITGGNIVGSVVGDNHGTVTACTASGNVSGTYSIGGVVGYNNGTVTACYHVSGNVSGTYSIGGVAGTNKSGTLTACYATGNVTGNGSGTIYVGGVTGTNKSGTLTACYHANGTVSGPAGTTGGVVGYNNDTVTACYWGSNPDTGIGYNEGGSTTIETTKVTDGNWTNAVTQMNAALQNAGSEWRYELTGALPTLKKQ
ncbi:hypothetical protein [Phocaeicola plebeius]|uniref:hypothetical protein n=1 Tax=Phocaeicola plebeius TaxID=310297 RepID=UPI003AF0625B